MTAFTYAELFAGAGGLSMGLELAGWEPVAHAEIEPHARAVLRRHWPECRLDGDVSAINGADYAGVTLLSGGSPCQDLSVAGKRAGMTQGSGTRSSLYYEQVRIWQESQAPYFLWENVLGALSSNNGRDFAAVLSALVGAAVAVPADGWQSAGVAAGPTGVAAWRVLDGQYFGPPQRRRRVFVLGARTGGVDPAEVLAVAEGVRGDFAACDDAREGVAADAGGGAGSAVGDAGPDRNADARDGAAADVDGPDVGVRPVRRGRGEVRGAVAWDDEFNFTGPINGTLKARAKSGSTKAGVITIGGTVAHALTGNDCDASEDGTGRGTPGVVTFAERGRDGGRSLEARSDGTINALMTPNGGRSGTDAILTYDARGNGDGQTVNTMAGDHQNLAHQMGPVVANTITAREAKGWNPARDVGNGTVQAGIPRRLMPIETEALMGWPRNHTATGVDEQGRTYTLTDTARYRLCGNGVISPVVGWIAWRLRWAIEGAL